MYYVRIFYWNVFYENIPLFNRKEKYFTNFISIYNLKSKLTFKHTRRKKKTIHLSYKRIVLNKIRYNRCIENKPKHNSHILTYTHMSNDRFSKTGFTEIKNIL